ncbi:MAG: VWA domain-containing protein [Planctomycetota bacterium]|nr:VWA domain-containing protein [Planctomycetota bacterium]
MHSPPVIAVAFGAALGWAVGLGCLPIIVHFLHRRRYRETTWAAMRFLLEATRKRSRRLKLEQLLLLAVRTAVMVLIAVAIMGELSDTGLGDAAAPGARHYIIVLDTSLSMGTRVDDGTRMDAAKEIARRIVREANQGDAFHLLQIANTTRAMVFRQPAFQKRHVLGELEELNVTDEPGNVVQTLEAVQDFLTKLPNLSQKEVVVLSDFQRANWLPDSSGGQARLQELLRETAAKSRLVMLDVGRFEAANLSVTGIKADQPFVSLKSPVVVSATVKNFGSSKAVDFPVELWSRDRLLERKRIELAANEEAAVTFVRVFELEGDQPLEVRIPDDSLPADNQRWLSLPVHSRLSVLPVDGDFHEPGIRSASLYLKMALAPELRDQPWDGPISPVDAISDARFSERDPSNFDCVVLTDAMSLGESDAKALEGYVRSGGGVVFCMGQRIDPEKFNQLFYRDGGGILPAKLGTIVDSKDGVKFDLRELTHPVLDPFRGNPGTGLESTLTVRHIRATLPDDGSAVTVLRFANANEDPAIVERTVGQGKTVLITTSLDTTWGSWPTNPSFPPIINELVRATVAGRWRRPELLEGDQLIRILPRQLAAAEANLALPNGQSHRLVIHQAGDDVTVETDPLLSRGLHELRIASAANYSQVVAVNIDVRESDNVRLTGPELEQHFSGAAFDYQTDWRSRAQATEGGIANSTDLVRWLLFAVLLLLLVETITAWNPSYGALALLGVVAFELLRQVSLRWPLGGAVLVVATCVCLGWAWNSRRIGMSGSTP